MVLYNLTNITASNSTLQQIQAVDRDLTGGMFSIWLVIALFVVIFINLSYYNVSSALLAASFASVLIGGLFWLAGLVPLYVFIFTLVLVPLSIMASFFTNT